MIIATLQAVGTLKPELRVYGDIVKLDLGSLLLEMDTETFKTMITDIITQAARNEIHIPSLGGRFSVG